MSSIRPLQYLLQRKNAEILSDGVVDAKEVADLSRLATDSKGSTASARAELEAVLGPAAGAFASDDAKTAARNLLDADPKVRARPDNELFRYEAPEGNNTLRMHELYVKRDGALQGDTGLKSWSRGWGQFSAGVLEKNHGSTVPVSAIHSPAEQSARTALTPAQRLDAATKSFGVELPWNSFESIAEGFTRPEQPYWAGVCYSWSWAALDARLSELVDVPGAEGEKGLWIGGQFLSRADLGNWLMALASGLSQGAGDVMWYAPEAEDLLKASLGYLMDGGTGFRADIGTSHPQQDQVWWQPFVGTDVDIRSVEPRVAEAVLDLARQPRPTAWGSTAPGVEGTEVKLVKLNSRFGNERGNDWEGEPVISEIDWAMYAVLDTDGKLLKAFMADDERLAKVEGLPASFTHAVPRSFFAPDHSLVDDILNGTPSRETQGSVYGPALNFFVGHVLARGIPANLRQDFEKDAAAASGRPLDANAQALLQKKYPTIANAYSPEEWKTRFASMGLEAGRFGAPEFK